MTPEAIGEKYGFKLLAELPADAQPFRVQARLDNGRRVTIAYESPGRPSPLPEDLTALERLILTVVREAGRKLTRTGIRAELARRGWSVTSSHLGDVLAGLVAIDAIRNDHDKKGYYAP